LRSLPQSPSFVEKEVVLRILLDETSSIAAYEICGSATSSCSHRVSLLHSVARYYPYTSGVLLVALSLMIETFPRILNPEFLNALI
jgi:hypothetical protein